MLVCAFCRESNPEDLATCAKCGRELRPGLQPMTSIRRQPPVAVPSPPPIEPGPRWGRIGVLLVVLALIAGGATWLSLRPQACDGKFSSAQFAYCVSVPQGWSASVAHIGPTDVDQFVSLPATAVVMSLDLRSGVSLSTYASIARDQDTEKGLTAGPQTQTRLGGVPALQWDLSESGGRFQGIQVVTVRDDVGWTVQLNDDEATFQSHLDQFRAMLSSFHFR